MVIFFHAQDGFRLSRAVKELKDKFVKEIDPEENAITFIDGEVMDLKTFMEQSSLNSLFVQKKLIIVNNLFRNKKDNIFSDLFIKIKSLTEEKDIIVVFKEEENYKKDKKPLNNILKGARKKLYDLLLEQPYSQEFKKLTNTGLKLFIKKELEIYKKEISLEAAEILISYFSSDLWLLSNELKKLAFLNDKKIISKKEIKESVSEIFNENFFALTDAISSKNKNLLLTTLETQKKAGLSNEQILASLRNYFKNLLLIKIESEKNNDSLKIANELKIHPFVVKKGLIQSKSFDKALLKKYFDHLIRIDYLNKKGFSSLENELFLLISDF